MKFGVLFMPADPPAAAAIGQRWDEILESAEVAEQCGFDGIFLPEHHFMASGFCSSPLVALMAIAGRTRTLRLGTAILVLPCYHPLKLAEDAAHVDLLSGGRLILGVGMGALDQEAATFGVPRDELVSRHEENFEVLRRAWTEEQFSYAGKPWQFSNLRVTPKPKQKPHPPLWMGGMSAAGARRAGRLGVPWMTSLMPSLPVLQHLYALYETECRSHGHTPSVVLIRDAWVAEDEAELEAEWWPVARKEYWSYVRGAAQWMRKIDVSLNQYSGPDDVTLDRYAPDRLLVGTPAQVSDALQSFLSALPVEYTIVRFRFVGGPSHPQTLRSLRLFGEKVIPAFA